MSDIPRSPPGLNAAAKRLWSSVVDVFVLDEHELALLVQAVQTVDLLVKLDAEVQRDGPLVAGPRGSVRAHPAAVEARQQRIALARLLAALRLPAGDVDDRKPGARPQRRAGVRGIYGIRSAQ